MANKIEIDAVAEDGERVRIAFTRTGSDTGTLLLDRAGSKNDVSFSLYDIRRDQKGTRLLCRADVGIFDPRVTCSLGDDGKNNFITVSAPFVSRSFKIEQAASNTVKAFLAGSDIPVGA